MKKIVKRRKILVVDDSAYNIHLLAEILKNDYKIIIAANGEQALQRMNDRPYPDLILLDIVMPGINGYEVCAKLKANPATASIPLLFMSSLDSEFDESRGLEAGALDYITKPFSPSVVKARIKNYMKLKDHQEHLESLVSEKTEELLLTQTATFMSLGTLAEFRDPETGGHIHRTSEYVRLLTNNLVATEVFGTELTESDISQFTQASPLHDIGKVGIPDSILLKSGKLTPEEFAIMEKHTYMGYEALKRSAAVLGSSTFLDTAMNVAISHHERWDGKGYPRGLSGNAIPIAGRIMAVADVYDALTTERPYKSAFSHNNAIGIMSVVMEGAFDPLIFKTFRNAEDEVVQIMNKYSDRSTSFAGTDA